MSITYKAIDPESGIRWCVRMVFIGDQYGLNHCLTYGDREYDQDKHDDPLIEFYDMDSGAAAIMRNSGNKTEAYLAEEYGQFVSRYYYSTLRKQDPLGEGSALTDWSSVASILMAVLIGGRCRVSSWSMPWRLSIVRWKNVQSLSAGR